MGNHDRKRGSGSKWLLTKPIKNLDYPLQILNY